ncbi:MAG: XTP/dITP diphosphatase [Oscillospiraceae bacterium]|nr:XTP/dITP diphosphatase [Oscillospiraceae bacterium]
MQLILASRNQNKLAEFREILSGTGVEILSEDQAGVDVRVEETGTTFQENARLKAEAVSKASGLPAVADDSGLCVEALGDAPGVYSARYGGTGLDDRGRTRLLLKNMEDQSDRRCMFVCAICCVFPGGDVLTAEGTCPGELTREPLGESGFGYDPVFFVPETGKTFAQLTAEEKNRMSHRGKALRAFAEELQGYLEENRK